MNLNNSINHETLSSLIAQLSELNNLLSSESPEEQYDSAVHNSFLFGFDINGPATGAEYGKYFSYMEIAGTILSEFGIHIGNNGYAYILDAIKIIIDRNSYDLKLKKDVYSLIAMKYNLKNTSAVEHSIRNAINTAYEDHGKNPSINKMGIFCRKPTNKQFLIFAADSVQRCMCQSLMETAG